MLEFRRLRGGVDGQRGSFERLVCHLAEMFPPAGASEFRKIEGAGGDGGVEAYWVLSNGTERGWQAKFHQDAGDINWTALNGSITTAMSTHPAILHVTVAMPCDLTDVRVQRGTSAREKWNTRLGTWKTAAGRPFNVEFLGGTQIERMLADPRAAGLREYWFGDRELSDAWFRERFEQTVASLDERYHPEDHVDVGASQLFRALRGSPEWRSGYRESVEVLATLLPDQPEEGSADAGWHADLSQAIGSLLALAAREERAERSFPIEGWTDACHAAIDAIERAGPVIYDETRPDREYSALRRLRERLDEMGEGLMDLRKGFSSRRTSRASRSSKARRAAASLT
jgi:phage gp46-like protein